MTKARTIAELHYPNKAGNRFDEMLRQSRINALEKLITKQLTLTDVSNQREPLLAYHKHLDSFNDPTIYNASESLIDDYLANNCG
mgnify:CR=1 FL=1|tara:strand:+ start:177 stop:431 length:255 start_codon:yes stop_codon:yes gene_type:complete